MYTVYNIIFYVHRSRYVTINEIPKKSPPQVLCVPSWVTMNINEPRVDIL